MGVGVGGCGGGGGGGRREVGLVVVVVWRGRRGRGGRGRKEDREEGGGDEVVVGKEMCVCGCEGGWEKQTVGDKGRLLLVVCGGLCWKGEEGSNEGVGLG